MQPDIILKKLSDIPPADISSHINLLSETEKNAVHQVRSDERRYLKAWAHAFVRQTIADRMHIAPQDLQFTEEDHKKPGFSNPGVLHFSISYTTDAAAVLISPSPVGLDLEKLRPHKMRFRDNLGTPAELSRLRQSPEDLPLFYEFWTRKEAWLKYTGDGLSVPLNSFDVWQPPVSDHLHTMFEDEYCISWCK